MKSIGMNVLLISTLSILSPLANADKTDTQNNIEQARSLVKAFGSDLKSTLVTSMKAEGPIKALTVCNEEAGPIAKKHSALAEWDISRTSTKVRNINNTPDDWESAVLLQFEKRKAASENVKTMEYMEAIKKGEKTTYRYMKPITTAGACLTCHGKKLDATVANKIHSLYPQDQATGFEIGDIRGAFSLTKTSH